MPTLNYFLTSDVHLLREAQLLVATLLPSGHWCHPSGGKSYLDLSCWASDEMDTSSHSVHNWGAEGEVIQKFLAKFDC